MIHVCGSPWGIGGYNYKDQNGEMQSGYGFMRTKNPHNFFPDAEMCSDEEIANHKAACEEYDKRLSEKE